MQYIILVLIALSVLYIFTRHHSRISVTLKRVQTGLQGGGVLLDVRSSNEYASGHAKGARNLPVQRMESGELPKTSKDKPVYVYCHSGARASVAKRLLQRAGYEEVVNIGGLRTWRKMGGTIIK